MTTGTEPRVGVVSVRCKLLKGLSISREFAQKGIPDPQAKQVPGPRANPRNGAERRRLSTGFSFDQKALRTSTRRMSRTARFEERRTPPGQLLHALRTFEARHGGSEKNQRMDVYRTSFYAWRRLSQSLVCSSLVVAQSPPPSLAVRKAGGLVVPRCVVACSVFLGLLFCLC